MKQLTKEFRVRLGETVDLKRRPTRVDPVHSSKPEYKRLLDEHVARLSAQQELLYASNRHAVLIIFQAMDAAGKDGCIKHVMSGSTRRAAMSSVTATPVRPSYGMISSAHHSRRSPGTGQNRHF